MNKQICTRKDCKLAEVEHDHNNIYCTYSDNPIFKEPVPSQETEQWENRFKLLVQNSFHAWGDGSGRWDFTEVLAFIRSRDKEIRKEAEANCEALLAVKELRIKKQIIKDIEAMGVVFEDSGDLFVWDKYKKALLEDNKPAST